MPSVEDICRVLTGRYGRVVTERDGKFYMEGRSLPLGYQWAAGCGKRQRERLLRQKAKGWHRDA